MSFNDNTNKYIGQAIRNFRKLHDYTLSDLSTKMNISYQQLQKYEKGSNKISAEKLYQLSKIFNTDLRSFFPSKKSQCCLPKKHDLKISENLNSINDLELNDIMVQLTSKIQNLTQSS